MEAAYQVASDLRPEDYEEVVEGHGLNPIIDIPLSCLHGDNVYFTVPDGRIAGLAGVQDLDARPEPRLWNIVYAKNIVHIKLLKHLGFKFGGEFPYGPNNRHFIEFQKCVPPQH
jgi:hypothetical protein